MEEKKTKISHDMKDILLTNLGTSFTIFLFGVALAYLVKKNAEQDGTLYFIVVLIVFLFISGLIFLFKTLKDRKKMLARKEKEQKLKEQLED